MTWTTLPRSEFGAGTAGYCTGPAGAPLLVLVHGVGLTLDVWAPQIECFAKRNRVLALDMPGHGDSADLPDAAHLRDYVGWLAEILGTIQAPSVSLVGHSMGALISLGLAVEHADLVARVALISGVCRRDRPAREAVLARAEQIAAGEMDPTAPLDRWFEPHEQRQAPYLLTAALLKKARPRGYANAYRAFAHGDCVYADRLHEVSCHLLALTGDMDPNSTPAMAAALAAGARDGRSVVVKGHRHMLTLTAPEAVNAALQRWMEEQPCK